MTFLGGEIKKASSAGRFLIAIVLAGLLTSCQTNPVTGRSQFIIIPDSEMTQLGAEAYQEIIDKSKLSRDPAYTVLLRKLGVA